MLGEKIVQLRKRRGNQDIKMKVIKEVMGKVLTKRIMVGGMLRPISAFLYYVLELS